MNISFRRHRVILILLTLILLLYQTVLSENRINYQGRLLQSGTPVDGDVSITFSIYSSALGGSALWSETQTVTVKDGIFNVLLGGEETLPIDLFSDKSTLYLGMQVQGEAEMVSRSLLANVPFALHAVSTDSITDAVVTSKKIAPGTVVRSINSTTDHITIAAGSNIQVASSNDTIYVSSTFSEVIPSGVIWMWSGSIETIPDGWALCDGTNSTPDLRGMFVVGAGGSYAVDETGGAMTHTHNAGSYTAPAHTHSAGSFTTPAHNHSGNTGSHILTVDEMPQHQHQVFAYQPVGGSAIEIGRTDKASTHSTRATENTGGDQGHSHTLSADGGGAITGTSASGGSESISGSSGSGSSLPPYYALAYIMKL